MPGTLRHGASQPPCGAELHGSCVRICTLMALERRLPAPARSRVYSCAWIPNMDKANPSDACPDSVGTHAPRQYICLAARLAFHQKRKRNASPAHRRPRRTHPQRPLDEPTARRFALAGALLGRRTRLSARSRRAISRRGGAPYSSRPHLPVLLHQSRAPRRERAPCERWDPRVRGNVQKLTPAEVAARSAVRPPATRLRVPACESPEGTVSFTDRVFGRQRQTLALDCGDFLIRRSDGVFAYQLAVVVDDAAMGVNEIVRGCDLLSSTPRQIYLQRLLGYDEPRYGHIPLLLAPDGRRLAKRDHDLRYGRASPALRYGRASSGMGRPSGRNYPR